MKTWKLVSGILSIIFSVLVLIQSSFAGLSNALQENGEIGGTAGVLVSICMLAGGIIALVTRKKQARGAGIAMLILYFLAAFAGFAMRGGYTDLKYWGGWCAICCILSIVAVFSIPKASEDETQSGKFFKRPGFWILSVIVILLLALGNSVSADDDSDSKSKSGSSKKDNKTEAVSGDSSEADASDSDSSDSKSEDDYASQLDTKLYSSDVSDYGTSYAALVVTNNSSDDLSISANFTAKDADGNAIGSATDDAYCVAAGDTAILCGYFDSAKSDSTYDYTLKADKSSYKSLNSTLDVKANQTEDGVVFTAVNNGEDPAYFVEGRVLFLQGDKLLDYESTYMTNDSDYSLNAGQTLTSEADCLASDKFDTVVTSYTSRDSF